MAVEYLLKTPSGMIAADFIDNAALTAADLMNAEVPAQKGAPTATVSGKPGEAAVPSEKQRPSPPPRFPRNAHPGSGPSGISNPPANAHLTASANHPWRRMAVRPTAPPAPASTTPAKL